MKIDIQKATKEQSAEIARLIMMAMTEDVVVDDRGYIIVDANSDGFYILRRTYED